MGNYFNELRCKIIRANNLLQFIHQVTIDIRFRKSLAQEKFKSNLVGWLFGFVALCPKSTAMVIAGRSVHLTTLFPGQA